MYERSSAWLGLIHTSLQQSCRINCSWEAWLATAFELRAFLCMPRVWERLDGEDSWKARASHRSQPATIATSDLASGISVLMRIETAYSSNLKFLLEWRPI